MVIHGYMYKSSHISVVHMAIGERTCRYTTHLLIMALFHVNMHRQLLMHDQYNF